MKIFSVIFWIILIILNASLSVFWLFKVLDHQWRSSSWLMVSVTGLAISIAGLFLIL